MIDGVRERVSMLGADVDATGINHPTRVLCDATVLAQRLVLIVCQILKLKWYRSRRVLRDVRY